MSWFVSSPAYFTLYTFLDFFFNCARSGRKKCSSLTLNSRLIVMQESVLKNWVKVKCVFGFVSEVYVHDRLRNQIIHKSMRPDEIHPRVLRELSNTVAKPPLWCMKSGGVPSEKKGNIAHIFKRVNGGSWELPTCQPHLDTFPQHRSL